MTATLVLTADVASEIEHAAGLDIESAGVLLARVASTPTGDIRVLCRALRWVDAAAYSRRTVNGLRISSDGYVRFLGEAEARGDTCLWFHTHPGIGAVPRPSRHDATVDEEISNVFRLRSGSPYYGAVIFSPGPAHLTFTGYLQREHGPIVEIDRMWCVGDRWRLTRSYDSELPGAPDIYDRNIRAFGAAIQETLGDLRVSVVGCGGIGSAVAEQLARLGVRHFKLFDPDTLSGSNVTRVYGSSPVRIGRPKTQVLAEHLSYIALDTRCETESSMVTKESTARQLTNSDVIFGCTDDNAGRLVLSRLSTFFLVPVIDSGVLLTSDSMDRLIGIDGRVTTLTAGQACLICRGRVDLQRAASELLTPDERRRRIDEGYAPALERTEPAVIAFTTAVASSAVAELLERLIGYGPSPRPSELLLRFHDRETSTNIALPREGHYCHPAAGKWGVGLSEPFLEQIWP